jgi:hypothetical protein
MNKVLQMLKTSRIMSIFIVENISHCVGKFNKKQYKFFIYINKNVLVCICYLRFVNISLVQCVAVCHHGATHTVF